MTEPKRMGRPPKPESERHTERFEVRPCPFCVGRIGRVVTTCKDCMGSGEVREKKMGRPPKPINERQTERFEVRCTKAQRAKLDRLGGQVWLRDKIDRAKEK